ncbi:MAG: Stp1/IreP family PP2C-type Ser/Thr phosphatase, partial [Proteobacteria bacterium]|nr:Stp1/IreP family PP2C-type Ser/Thr phosphatase [Pseudomonadota bacterium]
LNDKIKLYAVADGMGGHKGGEIASAIAIEVLESALKNLDEKKQINITPFLKEAVSLASIRIHEKASMDDNLKGMGTTLVGVYFNNKKCYIIQVGDSRVYLYRDGYMWKITEDHSLVNEQVRSGIITRAQADKLAYKNVITRSVGFEEVVDVDVYEREAEKGDILLLCSDGLTSMLSDADIKQNITPDDLKISIENLINAANKAGGYDNISAIIVRVN